MILVPIALLGENVAAQKQLASIAEAWQLQPEPDARFGLMLTADGLALCQRDQPGFKPLRVDFIEGSLAYRQRQVRYSNEALARAVGVKSGYRPCILDATAGLGRDASILAALGCRVQMLERHPVVVALLADGLRRAHQDQQQGDWLTKHLQLLGLGSLGDAAFEYVKPEVIYLDPMFPPRRQRALVKKEMQILQQLVGMDTDADQLLALAIARAKRRVVVKRPQGAPSLPGINPTAAVMTPKGRFDLYAISCKTKSEHLSY